MAIDMAALWPTFYLKDIARRANKIHTETDLDRWVEESKDWMQMLIEKQAYRNGLSESERAQMAESLIQAFNLVYLIRCEMLYGRVSA